MWARLSRYAGLPPERLEETLRHFKEEQVETIEGQPGFEGIMVAVDWRGGRAAAITYWDSEDHLRESEQMAEEARKATEQVARATREPIVDHYEVVLRRP